MNAFELDIHHTDRTEWHGNDYSQLNDKLVESKKWKVEG